MSTHGWGFCEAKAKMPEILFQRIVNCYISTIYYAGVAMVGKRFMKEVEVIKVDAWKSAFKEEELEEVFQFFFCDALPDNYKQVIQDEIRKHPLKGVAPATIPLSTTAAKDHWETFANKFMDLEEEVSAWAIANVGKLPHVAKDFRFSEMEDDGSDDYEDYSEGE